LITPINTLTPVHHYQHISNNKTKSKQQTKIRNLIKYDVPVTKVRKWSSTCKEELKEGNTKKMINYHRRRQESCIAIQLPKWTKVNHILHSIKWS
jgi:hypothetical protein